MALSDSASAPLEQGSGLTCCSTGPASMQFPQNIHLPVPNMPGFMVFQLLSAALAGLQPNPSAEAD